jgi:hypothetical protein
MNPTYSLKKLSALMLIIILTLNKRYRQIPPIKNLSIHMINNLDIIKDGNIEVA